MDRQTTMVNKYVYDLSSKGIRNNFKIGLYLKVSQKQQKAPSSVYL